MAAETLFSLTTAEHCFDAQFHPSEPLIVATNVTGEIQLFRYEEQKFSVDAMKSLRHHKDSCRTARFLPGGGLLSTGADNTVALVDIDVGKRTWYSKIDAAGNVLLPLTEQRFAVGDDDGAISIFDIRQKGRALHFKENEDFISDMCVSESGQHLCATSGDGTLAVYDLLKKGGKLEAMSDNQEDEYLACEIVKNGKKVLCSSQTGVMAIFSWGDFGDHKDRIVGHPMSVDAMAKISEDAVLTGSSDGQIRVVSVHHKTLGSRIIGYYGAHATKNAEEYPIERLAISPDGSLLLSVSHFQPAVRIWSMEPARKMLEWKPDAPQETASVAKESSKEEEVDSDDSEVEQPKKKKQKKKGKMKGPPIQNKKTSARGAFFSEL